MSIYIDIEKSLGSFRLSFHLHTDQRRIGILGPSGCGKSLTLKCIAGIEKPDTGSIVIDERVLYDGKQRINPAPQKRKVGYLFQNYALFPNMTVRENILAGVRKSKQEQEQILTDMIRKFRLEGLEDHLPGEISGGQQQRTALARILASEPDVILLDEPFSALDLHLKDQLQHELVGLLSDYAGIVIMVSHSRDEIYRFSEELVIIEQGRTICQGPTKDIFKDPVYKEAARLTGCKNIVSAVRLDNHHFELPDWNLTYETKSHLPEDFNAVGIRAHQFIPVWEEDSADIRFPAADYRMDELPFERNYYFRTDFTANETICWFVQRDLWHKLDEQGFPKGFDLSEEDLLFLR